VGCYESNLGPKPWGPATETRIAVVDPERGIVIGYSILHYGESAHRMQINEVFKILDGRIRMSTASWKRGSQPLVLLTSDRLLGKLTRRA
jgi:hypothetical protein